MRDMEFNKVSMMIKKYGSILCAIPDEIKDMVCDIRLKAGQPVTLCCIKGVYFLKEGGGVTKNPEKGTVICSERDISEIFISLCSHSVFSHENEIKNGFVAVNMRYRAGICGTAAVEKGDIKTIKDITSIVLRIPRESRGCSDRLYALGVDFSKGVLLAGEPSSGKTTFLRDLIASLSEGRHLAPKRISVIDERFEISGGFDLGPCADTLLGYPKEKGISSALRSLSPEIIACDEVMDTELEAIKRALFSGVSMIASVHASEKDFLNRKICNQLLQTQAFETIVFLRGRSDPGRISRIYRLGELIENSRNGFSADKRYFLGNSKLKQAQKARGGVA